MLSVVTCFRVFSVNYMIHSGVGVCSGFNQTTTTRCEKIYLAIN